MLEERDDRDEAEPRRRERYGTKRHSQAVIQAEIRRLARALDVDRASGERGDALIDCSVPIGNGD